MMNEKPNIKRWKDARFGMFIHWGLYSVLGHGEWAMFHEAIDKDEYRELMHQFTGEKFDASQLAKTAKAAGMKYMVFTTRHHDGFSLWDSPGSYEHLTSMEAAAHRDFVREYVDACRAEGLMVGFYYSPLDWRFPGFFLPRMYRQSAAELRKQTYDQVKELLTQYGKIDILWFDGGEDHWLCHAYNIHTGEYRGPVQCPGFWGTEEMDEMVHALQPDIIVNNRFGDKSKGDFLTPEQRVGEFNLEQNWESNFTLCDGTWGWRPDLKLKSLRTCIHLLVQSATGDGNFLLNISPLGDGSLDPSHVQRLKEMGDWLSQYGESIYGTRGGPLPNNDCYGMTHRDNIIYLHVWDWREDTVTVPLGHVQRWKCLTTNDYHCESHDGLISFSISVKDRTAMDSILKLTMEDNVES